MSLFGDIRHAYRSMQYGWKHRPSAITRKAQFNAMAQTAYRAGIAAADVYKNAKNEWYPGSNESPNLGNYYPGAEVGRFRNDWITRICTSTTLMRLAYRTLCARAEYAARTDPYAKRAIEILQTFVVGSGVKPFPNVKNKNGSPVEGINKVLADDWERFNEQGMRIGSQPMSMYEAQGLEFKMLVTLGNVLRCRVRSRPGSILPYAYSLVKPYRLNFFLDNYFDDLYYQMTIGKGPLTILGQVFNNYQEPAAFHILGEPEPISADRMSIHYRQIEAEQYLGFPWLTPALGDVWDIQQLFNDKLTQSRALSRMGFFIDKTDKASFDLVADTPQGGDDEDLSVSLERGIFTSLNKKPEPIQFDDKISQSLEPLMLMTLHRIAVGAGMSYQLLTTDLNGASFSGSRTNTITDSKVMRGFYASFISTNLQPAWNEFVEWEFLTGRIPGATYAQFLSDPFYYSRCYWIPEETDWIDPLQNAQAIRLLYMTGQSTLQELCTAKGKDWRTVIRQRQIEKEFLKECGLDELLPAFSEKAAAVALQETEGPIEGVSPTGKEDIK